jgi:DNA-binding transcriptional LysR family regulator
MHRSVLFHLIPLIARDFRSRFPNVDLLFRALTSAGVADAVARGEADLGVAMLPRPSRNLLFRPLVSFQTLAVVPAGHPLSSKPRVGLEEIAGYPLIAPAEDGALWQTLLPELAKRQLNWNVVAYFDTAEARLHCVSVGLGITLAAGIEQGSSPATPLAWIPIKESLPKVTFGILTRRNTYLSLAAKRFAEFLLEGAPSLNKLPGAAQQKDRPISASASRKG